MEPLSAFSAAASVLQFVDFTSRLISETHEIYSSSTGNVGRNADLLTITDGLLKVNKRLKNNSNRKETRLQDQTATELGPLIEGCSSIGQELLATLEKLKLEPTNKNRRWRSFRQAMMTLWSQSEVDALQRRIESFRQQMSLYLLVSLREQLASLNSGQLSKTHDDLVTVLSDKAYSSGGLQSGKSDGNPESSKNDKHQDAEQKWGRAGQNFLQNIDQKEEWQSSIIKLIHQSNGDDEEVKLFSEVPDGMDETRLKIISKSVLDTLCFPGIGKRYERIAENHGDTFDWLYTPQDQPATRYASFPQWLESERRLYWITGKPGAGKSTLMRFIHDDKRTKLHLKEWAGPADIITASFFFWNSGSEMQKSHQGLIQTLLHDSLEQHLDLVRTVLPHRWEVFELFGYDSEPWTWTELWHAFARFLRHTSDLRLLFLIDGLDEFNGDHGNLLKFISSLQDLQHVKICVSSRPWPVFEDEFQSRPNLMLQDLTYQDIRRYVSENLSQSPGFNILRRSESEYAEALISNITVKASGVFLWVVLVVRSLLEGLTAGDRVSDLQTKLDALPAELEHLFWGILTSLDPNQFARACEIFQLLEARDGPQLLQLSFADEDEKNILSKEVKPLSEDEKQAKAEIMRRRLNHLCKGLIEVSSETRLASAQVSYLHRTVKDFFELPEVRNKFLAATATRSFNPYSAWCRSFIMTLKTTDPNSITIAAFWDQVLCCIKLASRAEETGAGVQVHLLDEIDRVAGLLASHKALNERSLIDTFAPGRIANHWTATRSDLYSCSTFLNFAVTCQLQSYVKAKLERNKIIIKESDKPLLYNAVCAYHVFSDMDDEMFSHYKPSLAMIRLLFEHGEDPNVVVLNESIWERALQQVLAGEVQVRRPAALLEITKIVAQEAELAQPETRPSTPIWDSPEEPENDNLFTRQSLGVVLEDSDADFESEAQSKPDPQIGGTQKPYVQSQAIDEEMERSLNPSSAPKSQAVPDTICNKTAPNTSELWVSILKLFLANGADPKVCEDILGSYEEYRDILLICKDKSKGEKTGKLKAKKRTRKRLSSFFAKITLDLGYLF